MIPTRPGAVVATVLAMAAISVSSVVAQGVAPFFCQEDLLIFRSLRHGDFPYCRLHLRYRTGSDDCLRIMLPTCNVSPSQQPLRMYADKPDWILHGQGERIPCPPGPPPPSCPAGFPGGRVRRP